MHRHAHLSLHYHGIAHDRRRLHRSLQPPHLEQAGGRLPPRFFIEAAANRVKFGRAKSEKTSTKAEAEKAEKTAANKVNIY